MAANTTDAAPNSSLVLGPILLRACLYGSQAVVESLLKKSRVNVNYQNHDGDSALMKAVNHPELIRILLKYGADVDLQNKKGWSALMCACDLGIDETVEVLLQHGAQVNIIVSDINGSEMYPLMCAVKTGSTKIAKILLNNGANVNLKLQSGITALIAACVVGNVEIVQMLLDRGAEVNAQAEYISGWSALISIVMLYSGIVDEDKQLLVEIVSPHEDGPEGQKNSLHKCIQIVKMLLEHGAKVDLKAAEGHTALTIAAQSPHTEVLQLLLEHGVQLDLPNNSGFTALMIATKYNHLENVKILLEHGASVHHQNSQDITALMVASVYEHIEIMKVLLEHGAQIDHQSTEFATGVTALILAAIMMKNKAVQILLEHGAQVDLQNCDGMTALMYASSTALCNESVELLLKHGAQIDLQDVLGRTALIHATLNKCEENVKLLLKHGAQVDLQCRSGLSALIIAAKSNNVIIARMLLEAGACVDIQDDEGVTPLIDARLQGHDDVAQVLLEYGAQDIGILNCEEASLQHQNMEQPQNSSLESSSSAKNDSQPIVTQSSRQSEIGFTAVTVAKQNSNRKRAYDQLQQPSTIPHQSSDDECSPAKKAKFGDMLKLQNIKNSFAESSSRSNNDSEPIQPTFGMDQTSIQTLSVMLSQINHSMKHIAAYVVPAPNQVPTLKCAFDLLLPLANEWQNIGVLLEINDGIRKNIESQYKNPTECLREMLQVWLKQTDPRPTWQALADAVERFDPSKAVEVRKFTTVHDQTKNLTLHACKSSKLPTLPIVFRLLLPLASQWHNIGVLLEIDDRKLKKIETNYKKSGDHLREMIREWLRQTDPGPSWERLADAVEPFDSSTSEEIRYITETLEYSKPRVSDVAVQYASCDHFGTNLPKVKLTNMNHITVRNTYHVECKHTFFWREHGLKVLIEPDTLPKAVSECTFTLGVTSNASEHFQFPPNVQPVSAVYYIKPSVKLLKPVTLEIEHCLSVKNEDDSKGLVAMLAHTTSQEPPYTFEALEGGGFPAGNSWGQISVSSFTLYTMVYDFFRGILRVPIVYFAKVYQCQSVTGTNEYKVGIATSRNLTHCKTVVDESCPGCLWNFVTQFEFQFTTEDGDHALSFVLPENEAIPNTGWKIKPSTSPCDITKSILDNCEYIWRDFSLWWTNNDQSPVALRHSMHMKGVTKDNFDVVIGDPRWPGNGDPAVAPDLPTQEPTLQNAFSLLLPLASEWLTIGTLLGIDDGKMRTIEHNRPRANEQLYDMLREWLKQTDPPPTWEALAEAVEPLNPSRADGIREMI